MSFTLPPPRPFNLHEARVAKQRQLYLPSYSVGLQDDEWHMKLMSKCMEDRSEIGAQEGDITACVEASTLRSDFGRAIIYNAKRTQAVRTKWAVEPAAKDTVENRRHIQRAFQKFVARLESLGHFKIFMLVDDQNRQQKWVKLLSPYKGEDMGGEGDRAREFGASGGLGSSELRDDMSSLRLIYQWIDEAGPAGLPQSQISMRTGMSFKWVERLKSVLIQNYGVGAKFAQNLQNVLISPRFANEGQNLKNIERRMVQRLTYSENTAWLAVGSTLTTSPNQCKACNADIVEIDDKFTCAQCKDFCVCTRCFIKNDDVHTGTLAVAGEHHARDHIMLNTLPMARKFVKMRLDINIGGLQGDCLDFITERLKTEEAVNAAVILERFPELERYHYLRLVSMSHAQHCAQLTCVAIKHITAKTACIRKCVILRRIGTPVDTPKVRALIAEFVGRIQAGEKIMAALSANQIARKQDYPLVRIGDLHMGVNGAELVDRRSKSWMHSYVGSHMGRALLLHAYMWKFVYGQEVADHMRREIERRNERLATEQLKRKEEERKQKQIELELAAQSNNDHASITAQARNSQYKFFKTRNRKRTKVTVEGKVPTFEPYNDPYSGWPEEYMWLRAAHDVKVDVPAAPHSDTAIGSSNYKCDLHLRQLVDNMPIHLFCEVVGVWREVPDLKEMLDDKYQRLTPIKRCPPAMRELIAPNLSTNREVMKRLLDVLDTLKTMRLLQTTEAPTQPLESRPVFSGFQTGTKMLRPAQLPPVVSVSPDYSRVFHVPTSRTYSYLPFRINPWKGKTSVNAGKLNTLRSEVLRFKKRRTGWAGPQYHLGYAWCTLISEWVVNQHLLRVLFSYIERGVLPKDSALTALPETMRSAAVEKTYKKRKQHKAKERSTVPPWLRSRFSNRRKNNNSPHALHTRLPDEFIDPTVVDARLMSSKHWVMDNFGLRTQFKIDDRVFTWAENEFIVICNTVRRYGGLRMGSAAYYKTLKSAFLLAGFYFPYENDAGRLQKQAVFLDNIEEVRHLQKLVLMCMKMEAKRHPEWHTDCQRAIYHKDGSIMCRMVKSIRDVAYSTFKGVAPLPTDRYSTQLLLTDTSHTAVVVAPAELSGSKQEDSPSPSTAMDVHADTDTDLQLITLPTDNAPTDTQSGTRPTAHTVPRGRWAAECVTPSIVLHFGRNSNEWMCKLEAVYREVFHTRTRYMGVLVPPDDSAPQIRIHSDVATMGLLLTSQLYQWTKLAQEGKTADDAPLCNLPAYWMQHCMDMFSVVRDQFKVMHTGMRQHSVISDHNSLVITLRRMITPEFRPNFFHLIRLTAQSFDDVGSLSLNTSNTRMGGKHSGFTAAVFSFAEDVMAGRATINITECTKMVNDGDTHCAGDFDGTVEGHRRTMSEIMPIRCSMQYVEPDLTETPTQVAQRALEIMPYLTQTWTSANGIGNGARMCGHADGECDESCAEHAMLAECAKAPMGVSHVCVRTWIEEVGLASSTDGVWDKDMGDSVDLYLRNLVMRGALLRVGITEPMYVHPHHAGIWAASPVIYVEPSESADQDEEGDRGVETLERAKNDDIDKVTEGTDANTDVRSDTEQLDESSVQKCVVPAIDDVVEFDRNGSKTRRSRRQRTRHSSNGKKGAKSHQTRKSEQENEHQPQQQPPPEMSRSQATVQQDTSVDTQNGARDVEAQSVTVADSTKLKKKPKPDAFKIDDTLVRVIDPWVSPNPEQCINTERLGKFLTVITERVLQAPWLCEADLYSDYSFVMLPRAFSDLLRLLVAGRVLVRKYLPRVRKPDLFSSPLDTLLSHPGSEEMQGDANQPDKAIYHATPDCYVRLAYLLEAGGCGEE
ncbi:hypothetical protein SARC_03214 [Sphaeroforma arctica JP610]|uniref:Uncharacterized protein n=1 Tax=Sphaeroforma arctica JP610 TaxID=667725 RepID=A0A0L0G6U0_9EUKA|nr:hypothetical protein SARC_03214 [Sphaeroforma arctica JP610]KNC84571.1 hypothetical protein SARC_03214 [Sphaeroforma arctica JP610]|eukprot:XP_014158473.1 hypothetical protein SARC_03214 [Sphaeroforma arctica JP610]